MSRRVHLDANVILRFLRNDDAEQSPLAAELFERAQAATVNLIVSPVTLLEVFYVLATSYGMSRPEVARILRIFVSSGLVACEDKGLALDALQRITSNKVSFGDAYLVAAAALANDEVATFDRGILGLGNIRAFPLASLSKGKSK